VSHKFSIIGKKIKKAKQKLLFTELPQYVHHYSQYTNLAVLPSQHTHTHTFNDARSNGVTCLNNGLTQVFNIPNFLCVCLRFQLAPRDKNLLNLAAASL
jgi:hypothetical protein